MAKIIELIVYAMRCVSFAETNHNNRFNSDQITSNRLTSILMAQRNAIWPYLIGKTPNGMMGEYVVGISYPWDIV